MKFDFKQEYQNFLKDLYTLQPLVQSIEDLIGDETAFRVNFGAEKSTSEQRIDLCFAALIHGNEIVGIKVLQSLLQHLREPIYDLNLSLGFMIGNPKAAEQQRRFLEYDLNRSFGETENQFYEHQRAKSLEKILLQTNYFVDLHQTKSASLSPFFIFPYQKTSYEFAKSMGDLPIVTHWGKPFSAAGCCSDEFLNKRGGVGLTLELGQNGIDAYKIAAGVEACLRAIAVVSQQKIKPGYISEVAGRKLQPSVFTWLDVVQNNGEEWKPTKQFKNLMPIKKGALIAQIDDKEYRASEDTFILFPHVPRDTDEPAPKEYCRLLRRVSEAELP